MRKKKKKISSFKMKFSIQEEGGEKQIFFTFQEASEKTGLSSKSIYRALKSGRNKYFRRCDKKTFWIQNEETTPFIQVDGEDFFTEEEIHERFGISRTVLFNQLCKKKTHFLDSQEKSHEVTWKSDGLEFFLSKLRERNAVEKVMSFEKRKNMPKSYVEIQDKIAGGLEDSLMQFEKVKKEVPITVEKLSDVPSDEELRKSGFNELQIMFLRKRHKEILNDMQRKMGCPIFGADPM